MIYLSDRLPEDIMFPNPCNLSRRSVDLDRLRTFSGDLVLSPPPSREMNAWLRENDIKWTRIRHNCMREPGDIFFVLRFRAEGISITEWCIWK